MDILPHSKDGEAMLKILTSSEFGIPQIGISLSDIIFFKMAATPEVWRVYKELNDRYQMVGHASFSNSQGCKQGLARNYQAAATCFRSFLVDGITFAENHKGQCV